MDQLHAHLRPRLIAVLVGAAMVLVSAACSSEAAAPSPASVAGRYVLATIGGQPVPVAYVSLTDSFVDDAISLRGDATYDRLGHQRMLTPLGMVTVELLDTGRFSVNGSTVSFNSHKQFGMHLDGTLAAGTMTFGGIPGPFVYHRQ